MVLFLDADDVLLPHAAAMHAARLCDGAVKSCGYTEVIDVHGCRTGARIPRQLPRSGDYLEDALRNGLESYQTSFTSGHAWSRDFLSRVLPLPENDRLGPDGYLTAVDRFFGRIEFIHQPVARYRLHTANKGPVGFRFEIAHLKSRVQRKELRVAYAERWLRALGYRADPRRFRRTRDWRVTLMKHALSLMEPGNAPVPTRELVAAPFRTRPFRLGAAVLASACLLLIRLLPKQGALALTRRVLERTRTGTVGASRPTVRASLAR